MPEQTEYQRQHYIKNREKKLAYFKQKYAENPEKYIERTTKYHNEHPEVSAKAVKKWEENHPEKVREKNERRNASLTHKEYAKHMHLKSKYNLTLQQYRDMCVEQDGRCLICEEEATLVVDHDHKTGKVRGLLCQPCNRALGSIKDNVHSLERAILYLKENQ